MSAPTLRDAKHYFAKAQSALDAKVVEFDTEVAAGRASLDDEVSPLLIGQIGQIEWAVRQVGTDRQPAQELPPVHIETHPESRPD